MNATTRFTLHDNGTVRLRPGPGLRLRADRGLFVVTQEGDPGDHVLQDGEVLQPGPRGLVVVWALRNGTLDVEGPGDGPKRAA